jgi:hypothetical protein
MQVMSDPVRSGGIIAGVAAAFTARWVSLRRNTIQLHAWSAHHLWLLKSTILSSSERYCVFPPAHPLSCCMCRLKQAGVVFLTVETNLTVATALWVRRRSRHLLSAERYSSHLSTAHRSLQQQEGQDTSATPPPQGVTHADARHMRPVRVTCLPRLAL